MQLTSLYGGPLEFLLVVESTEDPAYPAVSGLISEFEVQLKLHIEAFFLLINFIVRLDTIVLMPLLLGISE